MSNRQTVKYYSKLGSRLGYKLVAGGHRHFGYYAEKSYWYIPHAALAMIDHLAEYAEIKPGDRVLDAGCGEGRASLRIAEKYKANVSGVDLVPQSIRIAKRRAKNTEANVDYQIADYNLLPFESNIFDVVFTLETFTHSSDPKKTLTELLRVLKPGGRVIIFDYSVKDPSTLPEEDRMAMNSIAKLTDCPSFIKITHDFYEKVLPRMGINDFEVRNLTTSVMKSLRQIYFLSLPAFWASKLLGLVQSYPNTLIAHYGKLWAESDKWRYITVKIKKTS